MVEGLLVRLGGFELRVGRLEIKEGEYVVVMGPSGVGKTVLLHALAGFLKPERGRIVVDGVDVTRYPPERRGFALVPQGYGLWPHMSVFENIAYGLRVRGLRGEEVRERVLAVSRALNIEHLLDRRPSTLSGGEMQRVALARALVVNPRLVLLDEPLAGLDPGLRASSARFLREVHRRLSFTALHVTHSVVEAASLARRVIYMRGGRVLFDGPLDEFLRCRHAAPYLGELRSAADLLRDLGLDQGP